MVHCIYNCRNGFEALNKKAARAIVRKPGSSLFAKIPVYGFPVYKGLIKCIYFAVKYNFTPPIWGETVMFIRPCASPKSCLDDNFYH